MKWDIDSVSFVEGTRGGEEGTGEGEEGTRGGGGGGRTSIAQTMWTI